MRLDRYLSEMGAASRSEIRAMCRKGRVLVNQVKEKDPGRKIREGEDEIVLDGEIIPYRAFEYYMLNKPAGVITAVSDTREKTVMDLLSGRRRKDLFPVGRLDKDTVGLLLITNDGELSSRLLSPRHHVEKVYYARVTGQVTEEHREKFLQGVDIGDETLTAPAKLRILSSGDSSEIELAITEGRYHQVKRMFQAIGCEVRFLKRLSMGSLRLDPSLQEGEFRPLTEEEISELKS